VGNLNTLSGPSPFSGGQSRLDLDPNGGSGITLNTGAWALAFNGLLVLDLPTGATLTAGSVTQTNSLIAGGAGSGSVVVRDSSGVGFATLSGSDVVRFTGASALAASTNNATGNFSTSGNLTMTAGTRGVNSLSADTTGGGTLDLGNQNFAAAAILFAASGDFNISSGTVSGGSVIVHQHSTGLATLDATAAGTGNLRKGGAGTLVGICIAAVAFALRRRPTWQAALPRAFVPQTRSLVRLPD
jgi:hypothetical protein